MGRPRGVGVTPTHRIRTALVIWPGTVAEVAAESGIGRARLNHWKGHKGGVYADPTEADATRVEHAIKALLQDCIARLNGEEW